MEIFNTNLNDKVGQDETAGCDSTAEAVLTD